MSSDRYVVLGIAQVRSAWFREVAHWSTSATLPLDFLKAMSVDEVRVRLRSGRRFSALLVDDTLAGLDRDLIDLAFDHGCAVVLVDSGRMPGRGQSLGASAHLAPGFGPDDLLHVLHQVATTLSATAESPREPVGDAAIGGYRGRLIAVTGAGGTGRSTVAMALAQGLATDARHADLVCLADLSLHAELAMLHDARDIVPGITELVEAHRGGTPSVDDVRALTWRVDGRGYHLLLGLRRHRDWTSVRPRALAAAVDSLRRGFRVVVAEVDDDLEGERTTGSLDVEERNAMAWVVADGASLVTVVASPGLSGIHALLRITRDLLEHGVTGRRILPLINRAPRGPRARAELARAFGELLKAGAGVDHGVPSPVYLTPRRNLEAVLHDGTRFPDAWLAPVCSSVLALLGEQDELLTSVPGALQPVAVVPGSLGSWTPQ